LEGVNGLKKVSVIAIVFGIVLFTMLIPPPLNLNPRAWRVLWIAFLAVFYWSTELIPIPLTSVLIILLLVVEGILPFDKAYSYFADKVIALMLAGEVLALSLSRHGVDRYIGVKFLGFMGEKAERVVLGMMLATSTLSMWIPNTAAAAIMAPIGVGMLGLFGEERAARNLGKAMMIGIAYAATIGGLGTPVGTPPNPITISNIEKSTGVVIGFTTWMLWGIPIALILTIIAWFILIAMYKPEVEVVKGGRLTIELEARKIGLLTGRRLQALLLFLVSALLWIIDPIASQLLKDWTYIASLVVITIHILPVVGTVTWDDVSKGVDWGVLFLIAGGLALGAGFRESGLVEFLSSIAMHSLSGYSPIAIVFAISLISSLLVVAFCSITATASLAVPLGIAIARGVGLNPIIGGVAAGIASTFAFILPANTPPNAIAYSYGFFKNYEMAKAGVVLMVISVFIATLFSYFIIPIILGI
jgi:sodium-dependent dicarboxylate transporter 2/3/5